MDDEISQASDNREDSSNLYGFDYTSKAAHKIINWLELGLMDVGTVIPIGGDSLVILIIAVVFRLGSKNVYIYTIAEDGIQYDLIEKQKLSARTLSIDLNRLDIPEGMAAIGLA